MVGLTAMFAASIGNISAQTNTPTIRTNYVLADSNFREVGGKVYNVQKSSLFDLRSGSIQDIKGDDVLLDGMSSTLERGHIIILKNYVGEKTHYLKVAARAMKVGIETWNGSRLGGRFQVWDCGTPHYVAVVVTNWPNGKPKAKTTR